MDAQESLEDYLERIVMLHEKSTVVRSVDLANSMGYSKPSISIALKKMKEKGLVEVDEGTGNIFLTKEGRAIGESTYHRHKIISHLLEEIGVSEKQALIDACKIEHDLSEETFEKLEAHLYEVEKEKQ